VSIKTREAAAATLVAICLVADSAVEPGELVGRAYIGPGAGIALPNLARLRAEGSCYTRLATTYPPLSPVAWSSFPTGTNPGKHNIFDFISRNPADYRPTQSSVRIRPPRRHLRLGPYLLPLGSPTITGFRKSNREEEAACDRSTCSWITRSAS
jgi:hypothetical protein